ncbi:MAG TPA: hypothetical protein VLY04_21350 [Bryobacteraceae bacterium]|nr:hypothetical protein [Bryobacteraceae bacterium]
MAGLVRRHAALWLRCQGKRGPRLRRQYTLREQAQREMQAARFLSGMEASLHRHSDGIARETEIQRAFAVFARTALGWNTRQLELFCEGAFPKMARRLAEEARRFDPGVSAADIFQASRNVWTAGALQVLLRRPVELTPALFGYSMLYPYTDNHLDDPGTPLAAKRAFNCSLRARLQGERAEPKNDRQRKVFALVERIERQYQRSRYPGVYRSLLAIQKAQEESVSLRREARLSATEVLRRVVAKGGTSVLADAYLAAGRLLPIEEEFAFGWGVLLQFADDLQDVAQDLAGGAATLFSEPAGRQSLDEVTNRVFAFGDCVFARLHAFAVPGAGPLKQFIRRNAALLLVTAAGASHHLYTRGYIRALEKHSPFRFAFVRQYRERFFGDTGLLVRLVSAAE